MSNSLARLANQVREVSVPSELQEYLRRDDKPVWSEEQYSDFISRCSLDKKPTWQEFQVYKGLIDRQRFVDTHMKVWEENQKKLQDSSYADDHARLASENDRIERKASDLLKDIDKTNLAIWGMTGAKKVDVTVQHLDLNSIHQQMRDDDVVDADFEEVDE